MKILWICPIKKMLSIKKYFSYKNRSLMNIFREKINCKRFLKRFIENSTSRFLYLGKASHDLGPYIADFEAN